MTGWIEKQTFLAAQFPMAYCAIRLFHFLD